MSAPTVKLDRSRAYATVHGEGITHFFEQDGLPFDHQGNLVDKLVSKDKRPLVEKKLKRLAKLAGNAPAEEPVEAGSDTTTDDDDDDANAGSEINFEGWLKDKVRYEQHAIFKEAKKRYSKVFSNYRDLAEFLVFEENVCGPEDVPTKLGPKQS
ncbi:hypothetical protein [Bradyrhizobium sp. sGM-13]|uniref:hypothetical protein n=1 Tax=Bradyrhizobium sp. sGM-13 TaxID=2831781 RepID=UPI001BCD2218|nr:hypothetical protein [Bradyrhizobium sp. sGM-13]